MPNDIVFKTFRTFRYPYLYDRHTNSLVVLEESEYAELAQVESGKLPAEQSNAVKMFQEQGLLTPNVISEIEHGGSVFVEQFVETTVQT